MLNVTIPVDTDTRELFTYIYNRVTELWPDSRITSPTMSRSCRHSVVPGGERCMTIHKDKDTHMSSLLFGCQSISLHVLLEGYSARITAHGGLEADRVAESVARLPLWGDQVTSRRCGAGA